MHNLVGDLPDHMQRFVLDVWLGCGKDSAGLFASGSPRLIVERIAALHDEILESLEGSSQYKLSDNKSTFTREPFLPGRENWLKGKKSDKKNKEKILRKLHWYYSNLSGHTESKYGPTTDNGESTSGGHELLLMDDEGPGLAVYIWNKLRAQGLTEPLLQPVLEFDLAGRIDPVIQSSGKKVYNLECGEFKTTLNTESVKKAKKQLWIRLHFMKEIILDTLEAGSKHDDVSFTMRGWIYYEKKDYEDSKEKGWYTSAPGAQEISIQFVSLSRAGETLEEDIADDNTEMEGEIEAGD